MTARTVIDRVLALLSEEERKADRSGQDDAFWDAAFWRDARTLIELRSAELCRADPERTEPAEPLTLLTGVDTPWPLRDVLAKLATAAEILLRDRDYDAHGWEIISHALKAARMMLGRAEQSEPDLLEPVACARCPAEGMALAGRAETSHGPARVFLCLYCRTTWIETATGLAHLTIA